jgi:ribonuclease P protein component
VPATHRFTRSERIKRRADFQQVYDKGIRLQGRLMTAFVLPSDRAGARLGIAATRKLGGAVIRNKAKRLIRELFRQNHRLAALDLVVIPRREILNTPFHVLAADYRAVLARARHLQRSR